MLVTKLERSFRNRFIVPIQKKARVCVMFVHLCVYRALHSENASFAFSPDRVHRRCDTFFPAISHELTTRALPRQRAVSIPSEMMLRQLAYSLQFAPLPFSRCAAVSGLAQRDGNLACCSTKGACHGSRVSAMHDKYVPAIKKSIKNSSALARNTQSIIGAALISS